MQYGLNIVVIVVNNGHFGTIRMHQERNYPGRVHGTGPRIPISPRMRVRSAHMARPSSAPPISRPRSSAH